MISSIIVNLPKALVIPLLCLSVLVSCNGRSDKTQVDANKLATYLANRSSTHYLKNGIEVSFYDSPIYNDHVDFRFFSNTLPTDSTSEALSSLMPFMLKHCGFDPSVIDTARVNSSLDRLTELYELYDKAEEVEKPYLWSRIRNISRRLYRYAYKPNQMKAILRYIDVDDELYNSNGYTVHRFELPISRIQLVCNTLYSALQSSSKVGLYYAVEQWKTHTTSKGQTQSFSVHSEQAMAYFANYFSPSTTTLLIGYNSDVVDKDKVLSVLEQTLGQVKTIDSLDLEKQGTFVLPSISFDSDVKSKQIPSVEVIYKVQCTKPREWTYLMIVDALIKRVSIDHKTAEQKPDNFINRIQTKLSVGEDDQIQYSLSLPISESYSKEAVKNYILQTVEQTVQNLSARGIKDLSIQMIYDFIKSFDDMDTYMEHIRRMTALDLDMPSYIHSWLSVSSVDADMIKRYWELCLNGDNLSFVYDDLDSLSTTTSASTTPVVDNSLTPNSWTREHLTEDNLSPDFSTNVPAKEQTSIITLANQLEVSVSYSDHPLFFTLDLQFLINHYPSEIIEYIVLYLNHLSKTENKDIVEDLGVKTSFTYHSEVLTISFEGASSSFPALVKEIPQFLSKIQIDSAHFNEFKNEYISTLLSYKSLERLSEQIINYAHSPLESPFYQVREINMINADDIKAFVSKLPYLKHTIHLSANDINKLVTWIGINYQYVVKQREMPHILTSSNHPKQHSTNTPVWYNTDSPQDKFLYVRTYPVIRKDNIMFPHIQSYLTYRSSPIPYYAESEYKNAYRAKIYLYPIDSSSYMPVLQTAAPRWAFYPAVREVSYWADHLFVSPNGFERAQRDVLSQGKETPSSSVKIDSVLFSDFKSEFLEMFDTTHHQFFVGNIDSFDTTTLKKRLPMDLNFVSLPTN